MKLNRNSFFVRAAYLWYDKWDVPERSNLCSMFWRFVLTVLVPILVVSGLLSVVIVEIIQDWWEFLSGLGFFVLLLITVLTLVVIVLSIGGWLEYLQREIRHAQEYEDYKPKLPVAIIVAIKRKYCPIVEIE